MNQSGFRNLFNRVFHKIAMFGPGGGSLRPLLHRMRGTNIGKNVWIAQLVYIDELHPENITIGDNCTIGLRSTIFSHFYWGSRKKNNQAKVVIEKDVFIGPHCVILPNVRIGEGSVIKAGTVVSQNVSPRTFWGVSNAEALGQVTVPLTAEHSYEKFRRGLRPISRKKIWQATNRSRRRMENGRRKLIGWRKEREKEAPNQPDKRRAHDDVRCRHGRRRISRMIPREAPQAQQICSRCVLPDTFPGVQFDERGVCIFCLKFEAGKERVERGKARYRQKFMDLVNQLHQSNKLPEKNGQSVLAGRPYDVLMGYSGGKDSSYTLLMLKRDYQLKVLAVTFDNGFLSSWAIRNAQAVARALEIDHVAVSPSRRLLARAFKQSIHLRLYPMRALERASSVCNTCMTLVKSYLLKTAIEMGIPVIAYGWSPAQAPVHSSVIRWNPEMVRRMQSAATDALRAVGGEDLMFYCPGERHFEIFDRVETGSGDLGLYNVHPLAFLEYNEEKILREIRDLGWESPKDTDSNSTNCLLNCLGIKAHMEQFGFHPYAMEIAGLVREGYMSREEGLIKLSRPLDERIIQQVEEILNKEKD